MSAGLRPFKVGQESVLVVGVEGVVEDISADGITIGGITLPNRLDYDRGVRYVSMVWPEGDETTCSRDHCTPACEASRPLALADLQDERDRLERLIQEEHEANHEGPWRFCEQAICRGVEA